MCKLQNSNLLLLLLLLPVFMLSSCASVEEEQWSFVIVGDSRGGDNGVNTAILSEIVKEIVAQKAEFVLFPGDLVNGSPDQEILQSQLMTWQNTMQPAYDAGVAIYPVRGNHEFQGVLLTTAWDNVFSGKYSLPTNGPAGEIGLTYAVSHKNVFVVALDQYIERNRINQEWLDTQLAKNTKPHVFAFGHEPAFKVHHSDCLDDYPAARDAFWASLRNSGCIAYACGHDHFLNRAIIDDGDGDCENDVCQYVVGTGGAPLYSCAAKYDGNNGEYSVQPSFHAEKHGYILVEVKPSQVRMTWFERDDTSGEYLPNAYF